MTPCEEMGLKVGDEFEVIDDVYGFNKGQIVTLENDDGSISPLFKGEGGICNGTAYLALGIQVKPINSEVEPEPQYCESVTRTIPDQPTIEQLAAEYRNRKDYAERKQQEADEAKAEAEAKLKELVAAGKAVGLAVSVAAPEPELVITDWRDLQVGDVVEGCHYHRTVIGAVCEIDKECRDDRPFRIHEEGGSPWWVTSKEFKFIRRPAKGDANA